MRSTGPAKAPRLPTHRPPPAAAQPDDAHRPRGSALSPPDHDAPEAPTAPAPTALHLDVVNDFASIELVNDAFNDFAARHAIPDAARRTFNIAFDDLINNIISYGYDDDDSHRILVDVALTEAHVQATIADDGLAFDPFAVAAPDLDGDLDERRIGGLGIHLVRTMMDEVTYERRGDRNVVVIRKNLVQDGR